MHKISFLLCFALLANAKVFAQKRKVINLPTYDKQVIHFGFVLAVNQMNFVLDPIRDFRSIDSLKTVVPSPGLGFSLGIVSNLHLGDNFDIRFLPSLSFGERTMTYTIMEQKSTGPKLITYNKTTESTLLEFPLLFKFKSARANNHRAYLIGGAKYSLDMASQKDVNDKGEKLLKLNRHEYAFELGFGYDFYTEYFKFSPEIKMSYGINNLLVKEGNIFTNPVDRLTGKAFYLSFYFE